MASYIDGLFNGNVNLSIASLPLTLFLAAIPHWYTIGTAEKYKIQGGWTNQNPRAFVARLNAKAASGKKLSDTEEFILRGQAAQQNGYEWWAVWAAAVIIAQIANISKEDMNWYTMVHVAMRIAYYYLYLNTSTRRSSYLRTAAFQLTIFPAVAVFVKASRALA